MKTLNKVASEVMVTGMLTAKPDEKLADIAERLVGEHISGMPVVDQGKIIGVITQNDLVRVPILLEALTGYAAEELLESGPGGLDQQVDLEHFHEQYGHMTVRDGMRQQLMTCAPETPLNEVARQMVSQHVHRVIVVEDGRPVGMITSLDLLAALTD